MKLADINIKRAKPSERPYKMFDGLGLYILVLPHKSKLWRYDYRFDGKIKTMALGVYPDVSLQVARERHRNAREKLAQGIDPMAVKKAAKAAKREIVENSFEIIAREWFENWRANKTEGHLAKTIRQLERDAFPFIGNISVAELKPMDVLRVCQRVESRGAVDTAHRLKDNINMVMRHAVITGRVERNPCTDLRGALKPVIAKPYASLTDPEKIAELLVDIDGYKGTHVVRSALALAPLVFVRPGELRNAKWEDIELGKKEWEFVVSKQLNNTYVKRKLVVPLSRQALAILNEIKPVTGDGVYVFPGQRPSQPISDGTINRALRALGYDTRSEITGHGFRAMARTVIAERLNLDPIWIERQLSHKTSETLGESYDRTQYLDQRREMMQTWADYLDELKKGFQKK